VIFQYLLGADVFGVAEVVNDGDADDVDEVFVVSDLESDFVAVTGDNFGAAFSEQFLQYDFNFFLLF
jgi:hypothetical protein